MSAVTGSIDRTSLTLAALAFGTGTGLSLYVGGLTPGMRTWRRSVVTSPFVAGETESWAVLGQSDDTLLRFRCRTTSESSLLTLVSSLVAAVEQRTWALAISVGSTAWPTLVCTRADTEVAFDTAHTRAQVASVLVHTTHAPSTGAL